MKTKSALAIYACIAILSANGARAAESCRQMEWGPIIASLESGSRVVDEVRLKELLQLTPVEGESFTQRAGRTSVIDAYTSKLLPGTVITAPTRNGWVVMFQFQSGDRPAPPTGCSCVHVGEIEAAVLRREWSGGMYGDPIDGSLRRYILSSDRRRGIMVSPESSSIREDACVKTMRVYLPDVEQ